MRQFPLVTMTSFILKTLFGSWEDFLLELLFWKCCLQSSSGPCHRLSSTLTPTMSAVVRAACVLLLGLLWSSVCPSSCSQLRIPPHDQVARVARFVAHQCDWASMATISTHRPAVGQPFSNAFSVSDGPQGCSSGVPYMYLTRMEISVQDLEVMFKPKVPQTYCKLINRRICSVQNYVEKSYNLVRKLPLTFYYLLSVCCVNAVQNCIGNIIDFKAPLACYYDISIILFLGFLMFKVSQTLHTTLKAVNNFLYDIYKINGTNNQLSPSIYTKLL